LVPLGKGKDANFTRFTDIADRIGLGQIALDYIGWGTSFFDYDNDGMRDLFVVNGSTFQEESNPERLIPMRNLLFWNSGPEGFYEVGSGSGDVFSRLAVGRGAAFADYDLDGDIDVIVVNHSGSVLLLRNDGGNQKHWLRIQAPSGARVEVTAGGKKQLDVIGAQSSYLSQNEPVAHFGLGENIRAEKVRVILPDGRQMEQANVPSNQTIRLPGE